MFTGNVYFAVEWSFSMIDDTGNKAFNRCALSFKHVFFLVANRTEPQCITCDGEVLWSSRYYYDNCSHFGAYIAPQSSISSDVGVEYYILECRGPGLPLAGEFIASSLSRIALRAHWKALIFPRPLESERKAFQRKQFSGIVWACVRA